MISVVAPNISSEKSPSLWNLVELGSNILGDVTAGMFLAEMYSSKLSNLSLSGSRVKISLMASGVLAFTIFDAPWVIKFYSSDTVGALTLQYRE